MITKTDFEKYCKFAANELQSNEKYLVSIYKMENGELQAVLEEWIIEEILESGVILYDLVPKCETDENGKLKLDSDGHFIRIGWDLGDKSSTTFVSYSCMDKIDVSIIEDDKMEEKA